MLRDRKELETNLIATIDKIKHNKKIVNKIIRGMQDYQVTTGDVQKYLKFAEEEIPEMDLRLLCLLTEKIYLSFNDPSIKLYNYFTESDVKSSRLYSGTLELEEKTTFPLVVEQVIMIDKENFFGKLNMKVLKKWWDDKILRYNKNVQRESRIVKRHGHIEETIKIYPSSVKEITERVLKNDLSITTLTINAVAGSSDSGDEFVYDPKKMQLLITNGTRLEIIDGMHRLTGVMNALEVNPDLDFTFQVSFKNFDERHARKHLAEISKINQINKTHIEALAAERHADYVVAYLQRESDLKDKISQTHLIHTIKNELVSYSVLADTIDEVFRMETKRDAMQVAKYLTDFFDYLMGTYKEEFFDKVDEYRKTSLINYNGMFVGYIVLANRMRNAEVNFTRVADILDNIDFSRENKQWSDLGVLENGVVSKKAMKIIKEYFMNLPLEEGVKQ